MPRHQPPAIGEDVTDLMPVGSDVTDLMGDEQAEATGPTPPQGSVLGRFLGGAAEMLNPIAIAEGAYQTVRHPITTGTAVIQSHRRQMEKAGEAYARGNYSEMIGHGAASLIPIVGPVAADIGEEIGATGDIARGLGKAAGLVAPAAIRPAVKLARRTLPPRTQQRAAGALERRAENQIVQALTPRGSSKAVVQMGRDLQKQAPAVREMFLEEGAPWTREGARQQIGARLAEAERAMDDAADARLASIPHKTNDIVRGLLDKRRQLTAEAVEGSRRIPSLEPPGKGTIRVFEKETANLAKGQRNFILQWLKSDLDEMPFQKGGSTPRQRREAFETWLPGDPEHAKYAIGAGASRVAGTPTQQMFHALGVKGSRGEISARLGQILEGKAKHPKLNQLADALIEAFDGEKFDFSKIPDETLTTLGVKRNQLKSPMTMPDIDDANRAIAARFFPEYVDFDVMPVMDPIAPTPTKVARPLGKDVIPRPNAARVAVIDGAITEVRRLGLVAKYESLRRIRQAYDPVAKEAINSAITPNYLQRNQTKLGARDVTGVLRDNLAKMDGGQAAANSKYHVWRTVDDITEAAEELSRTKPKVFRTVMARVTAAIFGAQAGGFVGALAGAALAPSVEAALTSGGASLQLAQLMSRLAWAIRKGDVGTVNSLTFKISKLAPAGAAAVNQATNPSVFQTQPGFPP